MTTLKINTIKTNMLKKGFKLRNGDHKYLHFYYNGHETMIKTKYSHGEIEIDDFLIEKMAKQIKLTKPEFIKFATCTLSEQEYINILKEKNIIKTDN